MILSSVEISTLVKLKNSIKLFFLALAVIFSQSTEAKDLGVIGQTYPIIEEDFLSFIRDRIQSMEKTGEWQRLQNQFRSQVARHADRPQPLASITKALQTKAWTFDPSLSISQDLKDDRGVVFAKAGTTINPLRYMSLHKALVFFDGDDAKQVTWAKKLDSQLSGEIKLILIKGSIAENEKVFAKPIYFDQEGRLTTRFQIKHVPALVQQEGFLLKISELAL